MTENFLSHLLSLPISDFSQTTILALQDCQMLANLNKDFLTSTMHVIGNTISLPYVEANYMQTLLSATLTNHQTCLDGLRETSSPSHVQNVLFSPLINGSKSYSVSLALFLHGWSSIRNNVKGRKLLQNQAIRSGGGRVREMVVVDPYGGGNFTTIMDAVAAAPNNTAPADGYYLIKVVAGVYEEYVTIGSKKKYIMIVGDGINKTIITGNRSVVDGWTTFNSATFGKLSCFIYIYVKIGHKQTITIIIVTTFLKTYKICRMICL